MNWSKWRSFPNPKACEYIYAPFGPGVYEVRRKSTRQKILFGESGNVAFRMTSLLPAAFGGQGSRDNEAKRTRIEEFIDDLEYRTMACQTKQEAVIEQKKFKRTEYLFTT